MDSRGTDVDDGVDKRHKSTHYPELRVDGREVTPDVNMDACGNALEPLVETPSHVPTLYGSSDGRHEHIHITKKVSKESNALPILEPPNTIRPGYDHIIPLRHSCHRQPRRWTIQPEMKSLARYITSAADRLQGKVAQVCYGLIQGLAHLHELHIALGNIHPDNVFIDQDLCLKVIDFDAAFVKDEDGKVDVQCHKGWTVPWIREGYETRSDQRQCGLIVLFLLDKFKIDDKPLRAFAKELLVENSDRRPSLVSWRSHLPRQFSDNVRNAEEKGGTQPQSTSRQLLVAKKRKLDGSEPLAS